jgi:hypothetical protein
MPAGKRIKQIGIFHALSQNTICTHFITRRLMRTIPATVLVFVPVGSRHFDPRPHRRRPGILPDMDLFFIPTHITGVFQVMPNHLFRSKEYKFLDRLIFDVLNHTTPL